MVMKPFQLRPQDVLILLKLIARPAKDQRITDLAQEIGISPSEVSQGLERLKHVRLIQGNKREPIRANVYDFLVHGVPYAFPVVLGSIVRGIPTAHCAEPLADKIISSENDRYVWSHAEGNERGQAVSPLYPSVPGAAKKDPALYQLLALVDAIRLGRAREQKLAAKELKSRIFEHKEAV